MTPSFQEPFRVIELPVSWQVPSLLLVSLIAGPKPGVIASISYLTIGLIFLPVFEGGGSISYLSNPSFGYLLGFIPASWITGKLAAGNRMNYILLLSYAAIAGLITLQLFGLSFLIIGNFLNLWTESIYALFFSYTLGPLPSQLTLCAAIGLISLQIRRLLFIK